MSEETIRNGQYCVVAYDEHWYRAVIGDFVEDLVNDVCVTLIDYGFDCEVKKTELRYMHNNYAQLPIQAINAGLTDLIPVTGSMWPNSSSYQFYEMTKNKELIASVCEIYHEEHRMVISLVDTAGDKDVYINKILVEEGFAKYE
jgi:hypothetical protein